MIKGLVFDKDGTLFDFNATWGRWAAGLIATEAGGDPERIALLSDALGFDPEHMVFRPGAVVIAHTLDEIADTVLAVLPGDKGALMNRMRDAATTAPQVPAANLPALLKELRTRGLALGVATNDAEGPARAHLKQAGIADGFDLVLGYDSGHGGKPAPGQLLAFCAATGLDPQDCAMVGDSLHDLHAGRSAGMTTVAVLTGPAPQHELAPFADVVLPNVGALPDWLNH